MQKILGLDISLTSLGWFLQDGTNKRYGSFKTKPEDGILIKRLMIQRDRFLTLLNDLKVDTIGIERPFLKAWNTEILFALHQFIFEACYTRHIRVVYITPSEIKMYACGSGKADKSQIIFKTKEVLNLTKQRINDDECDAYWVSVLSKRFWQFYNKEISETDLTDLEKSIFLKSKKGKNVKLGLIEKPNDSYFIF